MKLAAFIKWIRNYGVLIFSLSLTFYVELRIFEIG